MDINLNELNNHLLQTYLTNLHYLKEKDLNLFNKISHLSKRLENGTKQENYILELIDNSYFDIKDLQNNKFYYGANSYLDGALRLERTNFNKNNFTYNILLKDNINDKFTLENFEDDIKPLIEFSNQHIKSNNFIKIEKMVFIGTGLGIHILDIANKLKISSILIVEPNLEIFRLSLFLVDYSILDQGERKLYFNISDNDQNRKNQVYNFFQHNPSSNYIFKYELIKPEYSPIADEIYRLLSTISPYLYTYQNKLNGYERTIKYLNMEYKFLKQDLKKIDLLEKMPVLILSGGPSLDKNLKWIEENQSSFFIVSINLILSKLEAHNISPDLIICIDPSQVVEISFDKVKNKSFYYTTPTIFISQVDPNVIEKVDKNNVFMVQLLNIQSELKTAAKVGNVGTYALNILIKLGAKSIYLIGNDAAFEQDSGSMYAKGTTFERDINIDNMNDSTSKNITKDDIFTAKGNLRDFVKTTRLLLNIKDNYEKAYRDLKKLYNFKVYNLSDGLYIEGLEPRKISETAIVNNTNKHSIKLNLDQNSTIKPTKVEEKRFILYSEINKILTNFLKTDIKNKTELREKKDQLINELIKMLNDQNNEIYMDILLSYESLIGAHFNYILNMEDVNKLNEKQLNYIKNLWLTGIKNINKIFMN